MSNIWFIRMDKDELEGIDLTDRTPFIHSMHGICRSKRLEPKYRHHIFPQLSISQNELSKLIESIKNNFIKDGDLNKETDYKPRCYLGIIYWLSKMQIDDIVFARNKLGEVFLCKITGYVKEDFFDSYGCFQRPVQILQKLSESNTNEDIWSRTKGLKTIECNAQPSIESLVNAHLKEHNLV